MRRRAALTVIGALTVLTATAPPGLASAVGSESPPAPPAGWSLGGDTDPAQRYESLKGVSAVAPDDVWAVGWKSVSERDSTLVKHWDGTSWSVVPSPNPGVRPGPTLSGVDALSTDDAWAVGFFVTARHQQAPLVEHWNGKAWRQLPVPHLPAHNVLFSVSAVSTSDVWAVGFHLNVVKGLQHSLVLHWDGHLWSTVPSPSPRGSSRLLTSVSATSDVDAWTVGATMAGPQSLVEHWNGQRWSGVAVPAPPRTRSSLSGVSEVAPGDVWAVGELYRSRQLKPLLEHLTNGEWSRVTPPALPGYGYLRAVSGDGADDVWAVGAAGIAGATRSLLVHWDGRRWHQYRGLHPGTTDLAGVTAGGTSATWAVGYRLDDDVQRTIAERWNGHTWTR